MDMFGRAELSEAKVSDDGKSLEQTRTIRTPKKGLEMRRAMLVKQIADLDLQLSLFPKEG